MKTYSHITRNFIFIIIFLNVVFSFTCKKTTPTAPSSIQATITPISIPFGTVLPNQTSDKSFTISNSSNSNANLSGNVTISGSGLSISGGGRLLKVVDSEPINQLGIDEIPHNSGNVAASAAAFSIISGGGSFILTPGQSRTVTVRFSPTFQTSYSGTVTITHNATNQSSPTTVSLSGTGEEETVINISVTPTSIPFGIVTVGQSSDQAFTISNSSSSNANLSGNVTISGSAFSIVSGGGSFSLSPGQSRTVTVRFSPTSATSYSGTVTITHNATNQSSPTTVSLSGTGPVVINISVSLTSIPFGTVTVSQSSDQAFTISNSSSSNANLSGNVTISGSAFSIVSGGGSLSLSPGQSRTVTVRFSPTSATSYSGTVTIAHNATNQSSPTTVSLSGTGRCTYSISQTSRSFGAGGGTGSVNVTTAGVCSWTAHSNASWITITSGASGTGNATVYYSVATNVSSTYSRTGTLTIAGKTFTVNQDGLTIKEIVTEKDCYASSSIDYQNVNQNGKGLFIYNSDNESTYWVSFVRFDISSIPADATIVSAEIQLYFLNAMSNFTLRIGRLNDNWSETGVTWINMPFASTPPAFQYFGPITGEGERYIDVKKFVEAWHSGTYNNYGFQLFTEAKDKYALIMEREMNLSKAPKLRIAYYR